MIGWGTRTTTRTSLQGVTPMRALFLALLIVLSVMRADAQTRPDAYSDFDSTITTAAALKTALEGSGDSYIYLQTGNYILDNPVVIERTGTVYLHGRDATQTRLIAQRPELPMIIVSDAALVNFSNIALASDYTRPKQTQSIALRVVDPSNVKIEMQDCQISNGLEFFGGGTYQIQSCQWGLGGRGNYGVLVDHQDADLFIFGGDASNGPSHMRPAGSFYHVWQKQGRVRVYSTTFEGGLGEADIRIESPSALGPHVIADVRSEGRNGGAFYGADGIPNQNTVPSRILEVPSTSSAVDVIFKANGGAWSTGPTNGTSDDRMNCKMVKYEGNGTLWALGNTANAYCGRHTVEGTLGSSAKVVSVGNLTSGNDSLNTTGGTTYPVLNLFASNYWNGNATNPITRWVPNATDPPNFGDYSGIPNVPDDTLPSFLTRPVMDVELPGFINVKDDYGAAGDGVTDDTAEIQSALNANCDSISPKVMYFPAGTYLISDKLYLNHSVGGTCHNTLPYGGWIAGAGSGITKIKMQSGTKKGILVTDSFAAAVIQGITFETFSYTGGDPTELTLDFEMAQLGVANIATQMINLYDVVIDGGYGGLVFGAHHPTGGQCSSNVLFGGTIKNTHIGMISGHSNAIANGVVGVSLENNDYSIGAWSDNEASMPAGGNWFAYNSTATSVNTADPLFGQTANGTTWYYNNYSSDAPTWFTIGCTSSPFAIMFDGSTINPAAGATWLWDLGAAGGPFFLHSDSDRIALRVGQCNFGQSYGIKMHSTIDDWGSAVAPAENGYLGSFP